MCCITWDRQKTIWALRILSEVLFCSGMVSVVAAFTLGQGSWNVYSLVAGLCLFLFAAICLASSFCIHNDEAKSLKEPVRTITLPSGGDFEASFVQSIINGHRLESGDTGKNRFPSMKSIPVDSLATETASKARRPKNDRMQVINEDDQMSNAKTSKLSDSASDEGFNSGNQSPEPEERRRERRRNNRDESKKRRRNRKDNNPISKI